jgi:23S rRNA (pseudouridine1915-N3)-methyltransferase
MKCTMMIIGKTDQEYLRLGIQDYENRIRRYIPFNIDLIPGLRQSGKMNQNDVKQKEGFLLLRRIRKEDFLILLDERGTTMTSVDFSQFLQKRMSYGRRDLVFLIGGAFGFSEDVYKRADKQMSLSRLTFGHQLVRLFFLEQLYRALTIMKGEPYHHG